MKVFRIGWFCLSLITLAARAQQQPPSTPPGEQTTAPQTAPQQPPAQQPPAQQPPATPPQPEQAGTQINTRLPPPPPKVIDVRMPGEAGFFLGVTGWQPIPNTNLDKGREAAFSAQSYLKLATKQHGAFGAEIGVAAGLHNTVKIGYFFSKTSGGTQAPSDIVVFGETYSKGDQLTTNSKLSDFKVSFEYLTWPYPVERRHFRLKTLWQMQYVTVRTIYDNPVASATADSAGNITSHSVLGSKSFFTPAFGIGLHEYASRNIHFEWNVSGFAWPHRYQLLDTEATVEYRAGHVALRAGAKLFHFRTSPKQDYFYRGTLPGVFVGIRWHSD